VQLAGEAIVDVEYDMAKLVAFAWSRELYLGLDLHEELMKGNDVDDQPTPQVKLPQAHEYARLLSHFEVEYPLEFSIVDVMNIQSFMNEFNKVSISNINQHHQKTADPYFRFV